MRKLFKKIATFVATAAMVTAMGITAFAADEVHVAGAQELTGANWDTKANAMTDDGDGTWSIEFKNVPAGEWSFKVVKGNDWGDAYNLDGAANGMGDDAKVKVEKDGSTVVIGFDGTKAIIEKNEAGSAETPTTEAPTTEAPTTTEKKEEAKTKDINVRVKLDSSLAWDKVNLYVWDETGANIAGWPGTAMTKDGEYYTAKVTVPAGLKINMIVNNGSDKQTKDLENVDISSGSVEIALAADLTATVTPVTGDATAVIPVIATMLALGCAVVVLNAKKANR